ncbi:MAG: beta-lactamase [Verrucomicrobia bacterium]|nr:beta-lactamase [Verrucomicrobiota bacterium]
MTPSDSDHFNGKTFFNPGVRADRGLLDVLKWQLTSKRATWPKWIEIASATPPPPPRDDSVAVTWVNHATFLLQTSKGSLLTDPVFSERVSPFQWLGPKRVHAPGIAFEALPKINVVLLSHDHYDHCDVSSLRRLAREHQPTFIAPLGHRKLLEDCGAKEIVELDWWEMHRPWPEARITLTPSQHWSRRTLGGKNRRLWGGYALTLAGRRIWFVGDSGYTAGKFAEVRRRFGAPDLALIPIGAYEPRWFMRPAHMDPEEAVRAHREVGAKQSIAMHWGTFQLTDEAREAPVHALEKAKADAGLKPGEFRVLTPGETVRIG